MIYYTIFYHIILYYTIQAAQEELATSPLSSLGEVKNLSVASSEDPRDFSSKLSGAPKGHVRIRPIKHDFWHPLFY